MSNVIGLVLRAGGGSRGLAHLGVLQAIREVGVPVDVVGGTSQGAFMAALFAQGLPPEEMLRRVRSYALQMSSPRHLLSDVTLPILSLFSGQQFDRVCDPRNLNHSCLANSSESPAVKSS